MKNIGMLCIGLLLTAATWAQDRPTYCDDLPTSYEKGYKSPSLPKFNTTAVKEYKVQVAILKETHPADFPFHPSLIARYRPCEEVWVVESRESFSRRIDAETLKKELVGLGYRGAYITELVAFM